MTDLLGHDSAKRVAFTTNERSPTGKEEWLTPPHILRALGQFDTDPCAPANPPWRTATTMWTIFDDGLKKDWQGRVWLNPPYGTQMVKWIIRLADHGRGTALLFARTDTFAFFEAVWARATAILFLRGRLFFYHVNGKAADHNSGAPSVLVAYGEDDATKLTKSGLDGHFLRIRPEQS